MLLGIITIGTDAATSSLAYAGTLFTDLSTLIFLAIGIPMAFFIIRGIIGLMPKSRGRRA